MFVFVCIFASCSDDSSGPQNRTAIGIWNLDVLDSGDNFVYNYASDAIMEHDNGVLTLTLPPVMQDTIPYKEIWEGGLDEVTTVHFRVSSQNTLTGVISDLDITQVATFNNELTVFRTEGWEMLDDYGNVIGYMYIRGLKVGNQ